jgi:hypothetical protein
LFQKAGPDRSSGTVEHVLFFENSLEFGSGGGLFVLFEEILEIFERFVVFFSESVHEGSLFFFIGDCVKDFFSFGEAACDFGVETFEDSSQVSQFDFSVKEFKVKLDFFQNGASSVLFQEAGPDGSSGAVEHVLFFEHSLEFVSGWDFLVLFEEVLYILERFVVFFSESVHEGFLFFFIFDSFKDFSSFINAAGDLGVETI